MRGRTQAIKAAFLIGFLLLLLNLLGPRWDTKFEKPLQAINARLSSTVLWPKRTHSHSEMAIQNNNVSTTSVIVDVKPINLSQETTATNSSSDRNSDEKKPDVSFIPDKNHTNLNDVNVSSNYNKTSGNKLYANSTIIVLTNNNSNNNNKVTTTIVPQNVTKPKIYTPSTPTKPKSRKEFITALMQQLGINPCPMVPDDLGELFPNMKFFRYKSISFLKRVQ